MWLSAILFCLSVAAPAHSLEHFDDAAQNHCTLCIHKAHFNTLLPCGDFSFTLPQQNCAPQVEAAFSTQSRHVSYFHSRAPPVLL
ncbi:ABC-type zinc uptake system zinc chaperone [Shewanella sp. Isolate11]|uniref:ABC-type zinc uptake system zinc chaperone n=1 Tax=Shewanella sp. Isolate11 TaxID=2908530 RepID=UPI001EFDDD1C|nr:ABC-type zinc uptake system zinc chaperone [Shewanella sp. Isolate11]MCG9695529.1 ABC-type zinc uptake system zinc chaperone [Shewanella sp. Isolate11]